MADAPNESRDPKPGKRTTEFWTTSIVSAVLLIAATANQAFGFGIDLDPETVATLVAGIVGVYVTGRTVVKSVAEGARAKESSDKARAESQERMLSGGGGE